VNFFDRNPLIGKVNTLILLVKHFKEQHVHLRYMTKAQNIYDFFVFVFN
jgi:hypothetical protein